MHLMFNIVHVSIIIYDVPKVRTKMMIRNINNSIIVRIYEVITLAIENFRNPVGHSAFIIMTILNKYRHKLWKNRLFL